jgi:hypothetical protein
MYKIICDQEDEVCHDYSGTCIFETLHVSPVQFCMSQIFIFIRFSMFLMYHACICVFFFRSMPPKVERKSVINIKPEELILQCEWRECTEMFKSVDRFTQHVSMHLMQHLHNTSQHESGKYQHMKWCT